MSLACNPVARQLGKPLGRHTNRKRHPYSGWFYPSILGVALVILDPLSAVTPNPSRQKPVLAVAPVEVDVPIQTTGSLRVRNRSSHPVRVVLLLRSRQQQLAEQPIDLPPVHWDFAPWEGQVRGLLLALPDRQVQLQQGDVLMAFAQDGSRRYWGPFVVGETKLPVWNQEVQEWEMLLEE
jgi:hypothetical protein